MQQYGGGQYSGGGGGGGAGYGGPQEMYQPGQYMVGPAGQPRQPTGAVYFDPGQQQQRERPSQHSSRPHKGIPIVSPNESVH